MRRRQRTHRIATHALSFSLAALVGCSLLVDTSDIDQCGPDHKLCGDNRCVALMDPAYGCKRGRCSPCELPNAIPTCDADTGECKVEACLEGFSCEDCRSNILTDEQNCGGCRHACSSGELCANGQCIAPR